MSIEEELEKIGFKLPEAPQPGGNYSPVSIRNNTLYVAIQFPKYNGLFLYQGVFGRDLNTEDGYKATVFCALNVLAHINQEANLQNKIALNHMDVYYKATDDWDEAPKVADGASDFFIKIMGERGKHTRSICGVSHLPKNFSVGVTCSFSILL